MARHRTAPTEATVQRLSIYLRYGDQDGGHDTVTRYTLFPDENGDWLFGIGRLFGPVMAAWFGVMRAPVR